MMQPEPAATAAAALATMGHGFADPAHASQQVFRCVLDAMARPGRVLLLPASALQDLQPPGIGRALCAVLLTLLDAQATLHVDAGTASATLPAYLRFHTGVRLLGDAAQADFVALAAAQAHAAWWTALRAGSDAAPQGGATLIVEVPALAAPDDATAVSVPVPVSVRLRGPGVRDVQRLAVAGLDRAFWQARQACEAQFPRGIDLILTSGERVAAVPRSTRITLDD